MTPTLVLFLGGHPQSPVEEVLAGAYRAILRDTLQRGLDSAAFDRTILVTNQPELAHDLASQAVVDVDSGPFHFGRRLAEVIAQHRVAIPVYMGAGAGPLLSPGDLAGIAAELAEASYTVVTNNLYSADLVGFIPGDALAGLDLPDRDNALPQWFARDGRLAIRTLPRTAAAQFDVDTPTDLLILHRHPGAGRHTRSYLDGLELAEPLGRLHRAMAVLADPNAEVVVAGRVGSHTWQALEQGTACRVRLFAEERGMAADGREARGQARSLLGLHLEMVGPRRFFQELAGLGQAAFLDSRVLFSHLRLRASRADRFLSDLGQVEDISHPWVREFTQAAREAPIPVVLGGHSLVSGGLLALVEALPTASA